MSAPLSIAIPSVTSVSVGETLAAWLEALGVRLVFGVSGGGVATLWGSLSRSAGLQVVHCQHESGAAFCATEASLASGAPVAVFTTTGPGLTNALTGLLAAREEGARVLVFSGVTPTSRRHRAATQESGPSTVFAALYASGGIFDLAATVEDPCMLPHLLQQVEEGLGTEGGYVAHIAVPTDVQSEPAPFRRVPVHYRGARPDPDALDALADRLASHRCAIVAGFGARGCTEELRALAEALEAPVVVTPRGKGVFPARHPLHLGVLGFAGHEPALAALARHQPEQVLVLGSRLGEGSSQYTRAFDGAELVFVGSGTLTGALQGTRVERMQGAIGDVVRGLRNRLPAGRIQPLCTPPDSTGVEPSDAVSPIALMHAVQRGCVDGSDVGLLAESGNAFAFAIHHLALDTPRLRVSVGWGSMGHFCAGVVGAALGSGRRQVALVGDGAMQMQHELLTAVRHGIDATWIVLNDGGYGMCRQGMASLGIDGVDCELPEVDFTAWAHALGVPARTVSSNAALDEALRFATTGSGPRLLDVRVDRAVMAPISGRVRQLTWSGDAPGVRA